MPGFCTLFTKQYRRVTIVLWLLINNNAIAYYGLTFMIPHTVEEHGGEQETKSFG